MIYRTVRTISFDIDTTRGETCSLFPRFDDTIMSRMDFLPLGGKPVLLHNWVYLFITKLLPYKATEYCPTLMLTEVAVGAGVNVKVCPANHETSRSIA